MELIQTRSQGGGGGGRTPPLQDQNNFNLP